MSTNNFHIIKEPPKAINTVITAIIKLIMNVIPIEVAITTEYFPRDYR